MTLQEYQQLKPGALVRHYDGREYHFKKPYGYSHQFAVCFSIDVEDHSEYQFLYSSITLVKQ